MHMSLTVSLRMGRSGWLVMANLRVSVLSIDVNIFVPYEPASSV